MPSKTSNILFDKFEIIDTLKKDQHTSVYLANHIYLGKKIILKTLSTSELTDTTFLDRFKREAKILAQLDHPNLIKVFDFGTAGNNFYISFEYFEGRNLRQIIKEEDLSYEQKIHLCIQLFKALQVAHQSGVIHRDIKPENILVNTKLDLKIADFGLALVRDDLLLTHKSSIVGTPGYMSPEQIRGEELTTQTDLFSSGIVVYELFTGTNPFIGKDIKDTINNILDFNAEKDLKQLSSLPPKVQNAVINLLRKNFSKRTKTALEALSFFEPLEESTPEVAPESSTVRKINLKILYLSAIAIIIIALIGFFTSERNGKKPTAKADKKITNENVPPKKDILNKNDEKNSVPNTSTKEEDKVVPESEKILETVRYGKLFVEANPWAEIYINDKKIETTPLEQSIQLSSGNYELKLLHPDFPPYIEKIKIEPDKVQNVKINFYEKVGYLDCKIFPWGDIYIDGNYKSTSPLLKPIMLMPGSYDLSIRNPSYEKSIEKKITVKAKETLTLKFNFDNN